MLPKKADGRVMVTTLAQPEAMVFAVVKANVIGELILAATRSAAAMVIVTAVTFPLVIGSKTPQLCLSVLVSTVADNELPNAAPAPILAAHSEMVMALLAVRSAV
jgi:hypothetical protein